MDKLREEVRAVLARLRPTDYVDVEARCVDAILPIIQRERMAAAEKVRKAAKIAALGQVDGYEAMLAIQLLRLSAIIGGESDD